MIARFGFAQVTAARTAGGFLRLGREHAVRLVLGVLLAATAVWLVDAMLGGRLGIPEPSWGSVWNVLGALLVLCLLLVAMQARGRLVVGDFSREGEDGAETKVIGLAALLVAELYRFAELHSAQAR